MTVFDERPALSPIRRPWLLLLPVLAVLVWFAVTAARSPEHLHRQLAEFRGDVPADTVSDHSVSNALLIRRGLLEHPGIALSRAQSGLLVTMIGAPVNDQSQSEALDVLSLAQRNNALPTLQARSAQAATLLVLRSSPGPMVRLESARFLGHLGDADSVPALTLLQQDSEPKVRQAAAEALARISAHNH